MIAVEVKDLIDGEFEVCVFGVLSRSSTPFFNYRFQITVRLAVECLRFPLLTGKSCCYTGYIRNASSDLAVASAYRSSAACFISWSWQLHIEPEVPVNREYSIAFLLLPGVLVDVFEGLEHFVCDNVSTLISAPELGIARICLVLICTGFMVY